jgi:outer membrane protein assembly factor BamB
MLWLAAAFFPPAGLWILWRKRAFSLFVRLLATGGLLLYSAIYAGAVVLVLHYGFGLTYEFRGGYVPRLTFHKTVPNYHAVEQSRAGQPAAKTSANLPTRSFWNGFRGPRRDGHYDEMPIRTNWPPGPLTPLWRQPCGGGYASFAIAGEMAFTIEQRRAHETVVAYHVETGRELWTQSWPAEFTEPLGGDGPRATPAYDEGRIYALGALGEFQCLDAISGRIIWRRNIQEDNHAPQLTYGMSASPLIIGSNVVVVPGGRPAKCVVAYNKNTGARAWGALDDRAAYTSPMLVNLAGNAVLLVVTKDRAVGLRPDTGDLLWEFPWVVLHNNRNTAQPIIVGTNRVFLSAGYGTGCALIEVTASNADWNVREVWRNKNLKNKFTSSVLWQNYIYGLDEDILTSLDASTGARLWKGDRYGYGQLLLAGDQLIILSGSGELAAVKASPQGHNELIRFPAIRGKTWNHPALGAGRLLVRNSAEMACFDLR